jgi:hypothetical protein
MSSNSKLTPDQKVFRKKVMAMLPRGSEMTLTPDGVTVLIVPNGCTNLMATSIASPDEQKVRRKVGQFHALMRWAEGQAIPVPASFGIEAACEPFGGMEYDDEDAEHYRVFVKE